MKKNTIKLNLTFLFLACSVPNIEAKKNVSWDGTYIKALFSRPLTLDPAQMNDTASLLFANLLYDGLLSFSPELEIQPALAKTWHVDKNGKLLIFNLREDAKFHDGSPITANDVINSFSRLVRPGSRVFSYYDCIAGSKQYFKGEAKSVSGLRAKGNFTVEIELEYPFPPFISVLAGATAKVLPVQADTDAQFFQKPIGSGPFRYLSSNNIDESDTVLEAFDQYYGDVPKIKKLVLREGDSSKAIISAQKYEIHDLASIAFNFNGDEPLFQKGQHFHIPVAQTWIIAINTRDEPFNNINFRKAFVSAINANEFRKRFYSNSLPANGYIPPGLPGFKWSYGKELNAYPHEKPAKTTKEIQLEIPIELTKGAEIASYFEKSFKQMGFKVKATLKPWPELWSNVNGRSFQTSLFSMNIDYPDTEFLVRNFESTNPDNYSGLNNSSIDQLIRTARSIGDKTERQKLYVELVKQLNSNAITINLLHPREHYWTHPCVKNFKPNLLADIYIDYRKIWIDGNCLAEFEAIPN